VIRRGYPVVLLAALAITGANITAFACGDKATTASNTASGKTVTADMSADHCAAKGAAKAASSCCAAKGSKTSATTAAAHGSKGKAMMVVAGSSCSASKQATGSTAGYDAVVTGGGASCGGKGIGAMTGNAAHGCDACADMAMCESELKSAGSQYQVVPLKNGVMYVYTATDARDVRSVQTAISRRTDRINSLASVQGAKLCPDCKRMRGAMASGKLTREVVNIEGGSISLVTSSDPTMVSRLYAMAGLSGQKLVKS